MSRTLSIGITSYNRQNELRRCLESIDVGERDKIEIVISEDGSPKRDEIRRQIEDFKTKSDYTVISNYNETNLGFDRNLAKLISLASGDYVLFCSDDDMFIPGKLDVVLKTLEKKPEIPYMYTAYSDHDEKATNRAYSSDFWIEKGEETAAKYLYDGILFSGLIFKRDLVKNIDAEPFVNQNYFQIYLVMKMLFHYGGFYKAIYLIDCIADGENGYGTTELSGGDKLLADRKAVFSNLQFNKGLVNVVKSFDENEGTCILDRFEREYSLRTYRGLSRARREGGVKMLKEYWLFLNSIGIKIRFPAKVYYCLLRVFGSKISDMIMELPRRMLFVYRRQDQL